MSNMDKTITKKPQMTKFLDGYNHATVEDIFDDISIEEMME